MTYYKELGRKLREHHKLIERKVETLKTEDPDNPEKLPPEELDTFYEVANAVLEILDSLEHKLDKENPNGTGSLSLNRKKETTTGINSVAVGADTSATANNANAEGRLTQAVSREAHAEGDSTLAGDGARDVSQLSPLSAYGVGASAHAEGIGTFAKGGASHAQGYKTQALEGLTHAEGEETIAYSMGSHAEGKGTQAGGNSGTVGGSYAHAEGTDTISFGRAAHAEGNNTKAENDATHAEGFDTVAGNGPRNTLSSPIENYVQGVASHAEGIGTFAKETASHAEGYRTQSVGRASHAEGYETEAKANYSHAEGKFTQALGEHSHVEGGYLRQVYLEGTDGKYKLCDNINGTNLPVWLNGYYYDAGEESTVQGQPLVGIKVYNGNYSHVGTITKTYTVTGDDLYAVIDGITSALTLNSETTFYLGWGVSVGNGSHAEGGGLAIGNYSHAEGSQTWAAHQSHAEGFMSAAMVNGAHAEGIRTRARGNSSHAEGHSTFAEGERSHAQGNSTIAKGEDQDVMGRYNEIDENNTYAHIVGGGTSNDDRKNIHTLDWDGNAEYAGDVKATDKDGNKISLLELAKNAEDNEHPVVQIDADTTSTASPSHGETVTMVDSITRDSNGHVTKVNTKTVTLPTDNDTTYTPQALGFGYGTCSTSASTTAKVATLTDYELKANGFVAIKFTYAVPANATLNINSKGAKSIYHGSSKIKANIIKAGDIATFVYNGSYYYLVAINNVVDTSLFMTKSNPTGTGKFSMNGSATGNNATAIGNGTEATGEISFAQGYSAIAKGVASFAQGYCNTAFGNYSHVEGEGNNSVEAPLEEYALSNYPQLSYIGTCGYTINGETYNYTMNFYSYDMYAYVFNYNIGTYLKGALLGSSNEVNDGVFTVRNCDGQIYFYCNSISGLYQGQTISKCHVAIGNIDTTAAHIQGKYSMIDKSYAHVVGNGNSSTDRSNAHTLDWDGNAWYAGDVVATRDNNIEVSLISNVPYIIAKGNFTAVGGHTFTLYHYKQAKYTSSSGFNVSCGVGSHGCGTSVTYYSYDALFLFRVVGYESNGSDGYRPFSYDTLLSLSQGYSGVDAGTYTAKISTPYNGYITLSLGGVYHSVPSGGCSCAGIDGTPQLTIQTSSSNIHICEIALMP